MRIIKIYEYPNCSTCKKALNFIAKKRFAVDRIDIFTTPPSKAELRQMLTFQGGNFKKLFNSAGQVYQEMNLKEKLAKMTADEAIDLLASNGRLVKRPFVLLEKTGLLGFDEKHWIEVFKELT